MTDAPPPPKRPGSLRRLQALGLFVLQRLAMLIVVLWLVSTVVFFMLRFVPGGPFADHSERAIPPDVLRVLEAKYHMDKPLWQQYLIYVHGLVRLDLGPSMTIPGTTVNSLIAEKFPRSARLGFLSVSLALLIGVPAGMISAAYRNRWPDKLSLGVAIIGVSVPNFVLAAVLLLVFVRTYQWFPSVGLPTHGSFFDELPYLILPSIALTGFSLAYITRLLRSSMLDVLSQDFIRTARAKGLAAPTVIFKHALRNAFLPVLTYLGPLIAATFTGSFVIETIFTFPGLGEYFVRSISNRDYTVVLGVTVFYSAFLITMNMVVDVLYGVLDPRIEAA